jgi:hypothetical protein
VTCLVLLIPYLLLLSLQGGSVTLELVVRLVVGQVALDLHLGSEEEVLLVLLHRTLSQSLMGDCMCSWSRGITLSVR